MNIEASIIIAAIVALAGAVVWLWKSLDSRYKAELAKRDTIIADLTQRIRTLEDDRIISFKAYAEEMRRLVDRQDATAREMVRSVREMATSVNQQTEALRTIKCRAASFDQSDLPEPHPAAERKTDGITAKNLRHG